MSSDLADLKARYRINDAWRDEGFEGEPAKSCRSPFRDDHKPSFSVFAHGTEFKDHATGESGDVFKFIQLARNCTFSEALSIVRQRLNSPAGKGFNTKRFTKPRIQRSKTARRDHSPLHFRNMPRNIASAWNEGNLHLLNYLGESRRIDAWRKWPIGTTEALATAGFISLPEVNGVRGVAFPVHYPVKPGLAQVGFHYRHPDSGRWQFLPNTKTHGYGIKPMPLIIGHGHLSTADLVIITEGAWDAVSFAAWSGWLKHDSAWAEGIVIMGILGASNWKTALAHAQWPKDAAIALMPDNDPAGRAWKEDFLDALKERSRKVSIFEPHENDLSDQLSKCRDRLAVLSDIVEAAYF